MPRTSNLSSNQNFSFRPRKEIDYILFILELFKIKHKSLDKANQMIYNLVHESFFMTYISFKTTNAGIFNNFNNISLAIGTFYIFEECNKKCKQYLEKCID